MEALDIKKLKRKYRRFIVVNVILLILEILLFALTLTFIALNALNGSNEYMIPLFIIYAILMTIFLMHLLIFIYKYIVSVYRINTIRGNTIKKMMKDNEMVVMTNFYGYAKLMNTFSHGTMKKIIFIFSHDDLTVISMKYFGGLQIIKKMKMIDFKKDIKVSGTPQSYKVKYYNTNIPFVRDRAFMLLEIIGEKNYTAYEEFYRLLCE